MNLFPKFKRNDFFSSDEQQAIIAAIREAEMRTSGEVRIYIESRCRFLDPIDRAAELFWTLRMDQTKDKNAVLIYVAIKDHQYALFADSGIHNKVGQEFWNREVAEMGKHFRENHYADALIQVIKDVGDALVQHFPYDSKADKNELPDDLIFGK